MRFFKAAGPEHSFIYKYLGKGFRIGLWSYPQTLVTHYCYYLRERALPSIPTLGIPKQLYNCKKPPHCVQIPLVFIFGLSSANNGDGAVIQGPPRVDVGDAAPAPGRGGAGRLWEAVRRWRRRSEEGVGNDRAAQVRGRWRNHCCFFFFFLCLIWAEFANWALCGVGLYGNMSSDIFWALFLMLMVVFFWGLLAIYIFI